MAETAEVEKQVALPENGKKKKNCITHLLSMIPCGDLTPHTVKLPPRRKKSRYERPPMTYQTFVTEVYR